ncbi:hypothetical protein GCM10007927_40550 [Sulfitobacter pacificus]|uniref:Uncharacterized protein n=2 Tax=Rhodobacterales TaxID=204455 RepID=A0A916R7C1_9RHOB|nr:hypothetical protein GCM10011498_38550 [Amylibacter cionae]GLQ29251.1 hypothetical protein GCM10007927_40550 [Sulfitobacter pacificus]
MSIQLGLGFAVSLSVRCPIRPEFAVSLANRIFGQDTIEKPCASDTQSAPDALVNHNFVSAVNSC